MANIGFMGSAHSHFGRTSVPMTDKRNLGTFQYTGLSSKKL